MTFWRQNVSRDMSARCNFWWFPFPRRRSHGNTSRTLPVPELNTLLNWEPICFIVSHSGDPWPNRRPSNCKKIQMKDVNIGETNHNKIVLHHGVLFIDKFKFAGVKCNLFIVTKFAVTYKSERLRNSVFRRLNVRPSVRLIAKFWKGSLTLILNQHKQFYMQHICSLNTRSR